MTNSDSMRVKARGLQAVNTSLTMIRSAPQPVTESSTSDTKFENVGDLRLKLQRSQDENMKLQVVVTDLTQVNKRWQKYNSDRQIYVQKLLSTIQDQQEQLNHIGERSFTSSAGQSSLSNGSDTEIERLQIVEQRLKERVSVLEFQVKAHRDDWEAELNEKKQALKDKEAVERKVAELLLQIQLLSGGSEGRVELYCQHCGRMRDFDRSPPSRSRTYRTAVHLPCSPSRHSSTTSISTADDLVIDSKVQKQSDLETDSMRFNIKPEETSYSRSSTVPLMVSSAATTTHSSASSISEFSCKPVTVKSFVQIPIAKSSSVPEGSTARYPELPRMSLDSFTYSSHGSVVNSAEQYDGTETLSAENVICLRCGQIFPPNMHLEFLDHFPKCQTNRNKKQFSKDDAKA